MENNRITYSYEMIHGFIKDLKLLREILDKLKLNDKDQIDYILSSKIEDWKKYLIDKRNNNINFKDDEEKELIYYKDENNLCLINLYTSLIESSENNINLLNEILGDLH